METAEKPIEEVVEEVVEEVAEEQEVIEGEETPEEIPEWMSEESEEMVPVGAISKVRKKLKGRISEKDDEIETLKKQIEEMKKPQVSLEVPKRPKADDFDSDAEYDQALDEWYDKKENVKFQTFDQKKAQEEKVRQFQQSLKQSVDSHYERAEALVKKHSINPESYQKADLIVRQATESIRPGQGDATVDHVISVLGDGSEKVLYYLGKNKNALNEYKSLLQEDPNGLKAAVYLGKLMAKTSGTTRKRSQSPPPTPNVDGNAVTSQKEGVIKSKYDKAHKAGKIQEAYNLKKEARKAGFDTNKW